MATELGHLENAITRPHRVVIGLVDELVTAAYDQELRFGWQSGICHVSLPKCKLSNRIEISMRKSVARAALARIAVLCNEWSPDSVTPYGGQGEIAIDGDPSKKIRAIFLNTPETVSLELASIPSDGPFRSWVRQRIPASAQEER